MHKLTLAFVLSLTVLAAILPFAPVSAQGPLGTVFQYQGQLRQAGRSATGEFDFEFRLFDDETDGSQVGPALVLEDLEVENGLFAADLDFGPGVFAGLELWLEIAVREGSSTGSYTVLAPRQHLTATPYALRATEAGDADTLDDLDSGAFLHADGSVPAGGLIVEGTVEVDAIVFPDGSTQTTATTSSLPTVTNPTVHTPAFLTCGTAAQSDPAQWAAVALGTFRVTLDGTPHDVEVNFSAPSVATMADVANRVEVALRNVAGGLETVQWQVDHFVVHSGDASASSSITPFVPHSGGLGIDVSGAGGSPWTDCSAGTVASATLDLTAYSGHLVKLNSQGQINPLFTTFPGTHLGNTILGPLCFGSGTWNKTFTPPAEARYGLLYAVGGNGSQGQMCGLDGILLPGVGAVITCLDTGNVNQAVHFTVGWGTCTGSYPVGSGTAINGTILWYR